MVGVSSISTHLALDVRFFRCACCLNKDTDSGGFLNAEGLWVSSEKEAHDFKSAAAAMERCRTLPSGGQTVVLLTFNDPQYDIELEICGSESAINETIR